MVLFGGNNFDAVNELFSYDVIRREWRKHKPAGEAPPSKRYGHQAVATTDGRMLVFGGFNGTFLNDVHELTLPADIEASPTWRRVVTTGTPPCARDGASSVLSPDGTSMLVFGGFDGKNQLDDVHALDTTSFEWTRVAVTQAETSVTEHDEAAESGDEDGDESADADADAKGNVLVSCSPSPRYLHTAVPTESGMLVFGGYLSGGEFADDLWRLTFQEGNADADEADAPAAAAPLTATWSKILAKGKRPPGSFGHAAAADAEGNMWVSGGFGEGSFSSGLHVFEPKRSRWSRVDARGSRPSPRHKHTLVATSSDQLLIFGGNDFGPTRGFFELDGASALAAVSGGGGASSAEGGGVTVLGMAVSVAQLVQLLALLVVALCSRLLEAGAISADMCRGALAATAAALVAAEMATPPPGGLLTRLAGTPRGGHSGFRRTVVSSVTDVAAAVAAASLASLVPALPMGKLK